MKQTIAYLKSDLPSSIVVFLVALPLCLGIALASGAPLFAGIIAGIVGGVVIGALSGSPLSVSGPAAGLTVIVAGGLSVLGEYPVFLLAVVLAGVLQIVLGFLRAGVIGDYVPNSVIKGMLAAIGLLLILKQLPHLVGFDPDYMGDESFAQPDRENTFSGLLHAVSSFQGGAVIIGLLALAILVLWNQPFLKKLPFMRWVPGPLVAVLAGLAVNEWLRATGQAIALSPEHLVQLPVATDLAQFVSYFTLPDFSALVRIEVWKVAATIARVASLETLLAVEAIDKLDPLKRVTPTNRELKAQGVGNVVSGLLGGLPLTSVIVRSSANVQAGARSKMSTILHGLLLFFCVLLVPALINKIPLAALAAILIFTGYKLISIKLIRQVWARGIDQFVPFAVTIVAILLSDLLIGVLIGIFVGLFFMVRSNFHSSVFVVSDQQNYLVRLRKDVSFLTKPTIKRQLEEIPEYANVIIDATRADFIDQDVIDTINEFIVHAPLKHIRVEVKRSQNKPKQLLFRDFDGDGAPELAYADDGAVAAK
jgi:MFS superfamily sulfate permease-like transporter